MYFAVPHKVVVHKIFNVSKPECHHRQPAACAICLTMHCHDLQQWEKVHAGKYFSIVLCAYLDKTCKVSRIVVGEGQI